MIVSMDGFFNIYAESCITHAYMHKVNRPISEKQLTVILRCLSLSIAIHWTSKCHCQPKDYKNLLFWEDKLYGITAWCNKPIQVVVHYCCTRSAFYSVEPDRAVCSSESEMASNISGRNNGLVCTYVSFLFTICCQGTITSCSPISWTSWTL